MDNGGDGLGLNIAQTIAKLHQGTIAVDSALDKGTTFALTFPNAELAGQGALS